jgi:hypothetical protein
MRRVAPSVLARERLQALLAGGAEQETNIVSALVEAVSQMVVQELLEGEQADYLGGRGRYERRDAGQVGWRNGYEPGRLRTAEGAIGIAVPQVRGTGVPFRSPLVSFLDSQQRGAGPAGGRDVRPWPVDAGCGGRVRRTPRDSC